MARRRLSREEADRIMSGAMGEPNGTSDDHTSREDPFPDGVTITGDRIKPKKVAWLWPGRVSSNKLTTFAGVGGLGKTFVLCDVTARITAGLPWPDCGEPAPRGRVVFVSGEDDLDDTLVPRLLSCGADVSRVHFLREEALDALHLANLTILERAVAECKGECRLIVIDPPTAYLGGVDDHKNTELRSVVLSPMKAFAKRLHVGIAFNTHVNKGSGAKVEAAMRVMGSVAWVNGVRSANIFAKDPEDPSRRLMVPLKINIGKELKGLAFRLEELPDDRARVLWLPGDVDVTADQAMNREPNRPRRVVAGEWLVEQFREKREWDSDELFKAARAANVSRNALFEAKDKLDLPRARKVTHENGSTMWVWWVPEDWPQLQPSRSQENGSVGSVETDEFM